MACPAWEDCSKKSCIEQSVCMGDYWIEFWKSGVKTSKETSKVLEPLSRRKFHYTERKVCLRDTTGCDKKDACGILGQCIIEHPRIAKNKHLKDALRGPLQVGNVVKILKDHDPAPFKSYYPKKKKTEK